MIFIRVLSLPKDGERKFMGNSPENGIAQKLVVKFYVFLWLNKNSPISVVGMSRVRSSGNILAVGSVI